MALSKNIKNLRQIKIKGYVHAIYVIDGQTIYLRRIEKTHTEAELVKMISERERVELTAADIERLDI